MLQVENLSREFVRGGKRFPAVDHVSFQADTGELLVVIGQSGSGKSTLFHLISGMIRPTEGTIRFLGRDVTKMSVSEITRLRGTDMGYIMQGQNLLQNLTVMENIYLPVSMNKRMKNADFDIQELLDTFGLSHLAEEYPENLSGGEQRRVSIARSFVQKPQLVIADEPTSNLDPENTKIIMEYFRKMSESGTTVLVSTHNMDFVNYADRCLEMDKGHLKEKG